MALIDRTFSVNVRAGIFKVRIVVADEQGNVLAEEDGKVGEAQKVFEAAAKKVMGVLA